MSISVIELSEREPCVMCGYRLCFEKGYGPDFGLCSACATEIVQSYDETHGGEKVQARPRPQLSVSARWRVLRRDNYTCMSCGETERPLHVDHIIPRCQGGDDDEDNLQALCDKCNLKKGGK